MAHDDGLGQHCDQLRASGDLGLHLEELQRTAALLVNVGDTGAEVDLVTEFGIVPKQDVHFMMTTGSIAQGQAALYVCEVSTGKFGVYTMGAAESGGIQIRRHDMTTFRAAKPGTVNTAGGTDK